MSKIKALEKLREWASQHKGWSYYDVEINEIADEIEHEITVLQECWAQEMREHADDSVILAELALENAELKREIAEKYMELPVDADGMPIHVGDVMEGNGEVLFVAHDKVVFEEDNASPVYRYAKGQHHVKPRTIEDILRDVWEEALDYAKSYIWRNPDEVFAERADEIRVMFGECGDD